jgi:hypothetical protein
MTIRFIIFGVLFLLSVNIVAAINIHISPDEINLANVLNGGYAEKTITITTDSEYSLQITLLSAGQIKDWISFSPNTSRKVSKSSPLALKMIVSPPKTAAEGIYSGSVMAYFEQKLSEIDYSDSSFELEIVVKITDEIIKQATVKNIFVRDTEENHPIDFFIDVANIGNVEAKPIVRVEIGGKSDICEEVLLPFEEKEIIITSDKYELSIGDYTAYVNILLDNVPIRKEPMSFSIVEENSLIRKGILLDIGNKEKVHVNDRVRIDPLFRNNGQISVYAEFKGKVYFNDTIVQEIESEKLYAPVNKTIILTSYFIPNKIGLHKIIGHVLYSTTITEEKEAIVDVRPSSEPLEVVPLGMTPWGVLFLIILFLVISNIVLRKKIAEEKH